MSAPHVIAYTSDDPACPPGMRAVAHAFAYDTATGRHELLPATQTGADPEWCAEKLTAFLKSEIARVTRRAENALATGKRISGYFARRRGGPGDGP